MPHSKKAHALSPAGALAPTSTSLTPPPIPPQDATTLGLMGDSKGNIFDKFAVDFTKKYGEGGYGATFGASDKATGEALAVKIIDTRRMKPAAIQKECQILEVLTHANVISVKGHGLGVDKQAHL